MNSAMLSQHASVRAKQRGVPHVLIEALLVHADIDLPVGSGCTAFRLSRRRLQDRELRRQLGSTLDRLAGLALVCADETGEVVTVLHDHGGAEGRRYRRMT